MNNEPNNEMLQTIIMILFSSFFFFLYSLEVNVNIASAIFCIMIPIVLEVFQSSLNSLFVKSVSCNNTSLHDIRHL